MEQKFPVPLLPEVVDGVFVVVAAAVVVAYTKILSLLINYY